MNVTRCTRVVENRVLEGAVLEERVCRLDVLKVAAFEP